MTTKKKRGPGRPKLSPSERRTEVLSVRLTEEVMAAIDSQADHAALSSSSWAAWVLAQACGIEEGPFAPRPVSRGLMTFPGPDSIEDESERALAKDLLRD